MRSIYAIADCIKCGKHWDGDDGIEKGRYHSQSTGHEVRWEKTKGGVFRYPKVLEGFLTRIENQPD